MPVWNAILLGLAEGLGEFFPISGTGHFVLLQSVFRIDMAEDLLFAALLHFAALLAVIVSFLPDLRYLLGESLQALHVVPVPRGSKKNGLRRRLLSLLLFAALPLLPALLLRRPAETLMNNSFFTGFALLASGGLLFWAERSGHGNKDVRSATVTDALAVGVMQALAILPGFSRTAATVGTGMLRGFDRSFAVKFSFLLSVPAFLGMNVLTLIDAFGAGVDFSRLPVYLLGMAVAFFSGYAALYLLRMIVQRGRIGAFAYYCWGAGLITLILSLVS